MTDTVFTDSVHPFVLSNGQQSLAYPVRLAGSSLWWIWFVVTVGVFAGVFLAILAWGAIVNANIAHFSCITAGTC